MHNFWIICLIFIINIIAVFTYLPYLLYILPLLEASFFSLISPTNFVVKKMPRQPLARAEGGQFWQILLVLSKNDAKSGRLTAFVFSKKISSDVQSSQAAFFIE
jgi:hypothetical protein